MAVIDVKITDLDPVDKLKPTDLFLVADPKLNIDGTPIAGNMYTSNSISGAALSSTIKHTITNEHTTICSEWDYDIKIKIDNPFFGSMTNNLCSASDIENRFGYKPTNPNLISSSSKINGDTIVNKDYVDQLTKLLYQNIISNLISGFTTVYDANNILQSQQGYIIHSTRLSASESFRSVTASTDIYGNSRHDAMLRYFFGDGRTIANFGGFELKSPDTAWLMHGPYFLRGVNPSDNPNSKVMPNNNKKLDSGFGGGADSVKMTSGMLIEHNHKITSTNAKLTASAWFTNESKCSITIGEGNYARPQDEQEKGSGTSGGKSGTFNPSQVSKTFPGSCSGSLGASVNYDNNSKTDNTGKSSSNITPIPTLPVYKNVFIWERVR